ncbi:hypothetical protein OIDMADRAFT_204885 [Oidiodendron maius Zn]|uniref:Heterokaryon incompatibility domain-containing protein n=1 Tax=Oidiodendron maius (strain Zn) TaxID=913774 RepID=A0A0C3GYQ7_OIDMZ|nr:hypothetical protein OIDMADRAFT_204885 [Oidiodendron maius Zn]
MANFEYKPISLEGSAFRLLRLLKGHANPIHCQLFDASPERLCDYAALSYTWGAEKTPCDIVINESNIRVTKNVYLALRDIYHQGKDLVLWVDALCIDQNNNDERGQQVQQMGSIYNKAKRVIIWLGEATYDTDYIMDHMKQLEEGLKHTSNSQEISCIWSKVICNLRPDQKDLLVEGLQVLLHRSWFKRVWIIQETGNAQAAIIICGSKSVSASVFACMPALLGITLDLHCQSIIDIMPGPSRDSSWWAKKRDLYTMLYKFRNSEATKPQDRIFALLGISLDIYSTNTLKADYRKDIQDVVFDTISFLLNFNTLNIYRFFNWRVLDLFKNLDILANEVLKCAMNTSHEWAIQEGHGAVVKLLLEKGAKLETTDDYS